MLIAEFRIKISGKLDRQELVKLDPCLDDMAAALKQQATIIFNSTLPAALKRKVMLSFEE